MAWIAGALSGLLGGLAGNQGGIRSAALLGFNLSKDAFVGTATAVALFVDGARLPVYLVTQGPNILELWPSVGLASMGVIAGTLLGSRTTRALARDVVSTRPCTDSRDLGDSDVRARCRRIVSNEQSRRHQRAEFPGSVTQAEVS